MISEHVKEIQESIPSLYETDYNFADYMIKVEEEKHYDFDQYQQFINDHFYSLFQIIYTSIENNGLLKISINKLRVIDSFCPIKSSNK